jgi:hypothetical protein
MPKLRLRAKLRNWTGFQKRGDQLAIILSLVIGVIVGVTVVAFILLTGRLGGTYVSAWERCLAGADSNGRLAR